MYIHCRAANFKRAAGDCRPPRALLQDRGHGKTTDRLAMTFFVGWQLREHVEQLQRLPEVLEPDIVVVLVHIAVVVAVS